MELIKSGSKPGAGDYQCIKCNLVTRIYSDSQILPSCPAPCNGSDFQKLQSLGSSK